VAATIEKLLDDGRESAGESRARCDSPGHPDGAGLELAPPPGPECDCRSALRRILIARDRYLAALGDGLAPFDLPEEDEYLTAIAAARDLVHGPRA
jgi:hypothetical protein